MSVQSYTAGSFTFSFHNNGCLPSLARLAPEGSLVKTMTSDFSVQALSDSLAEHATHLHSLYASLGASSDTVPTKMRELQERLASCVKEQRSEAEKEVAAVHEQLEQLQTELVALAGLLACKLSPESDQEVVSSLWLHSKRKMSG